MTKIVIPSDPDKDARIVRLLEGLDGILEYTTSAAIFVIVEQGETRDLFERLLAASGTEFYILDGEDPAARHFLPRQCAENAAEGATVMVGAGVIEAIHEAWAPPAGEEPQPVPGTRLANATCEHCREPFYARRKDMRYCRKAECQKAKKAAYKNKPAALPIPEGAEEPGTNASAPAVELVDDAPAINSNGTAAEGSVTAADTAGHQPLSPMYCFCILTGKEAGAWKTQLQVSTACAFNEMEPGQLLRNARGETYQVKQGDRHQKLQRVDPESVSAETAVAA